MKKTITIILFITVLVSLTLSGCAIQNLFLDKKTTRLSIWHVYGSQTESPMNDIIDDFNQSVGKDNHIIVEVTSISDSTAIDEAIINAADKGELPDIFTAYPRIVNEINKDVLLNWKDYFSETELNEYVDDFLNEGYFGDQLLMFPLAKSTELFFLNKTLFEKFSDNTDFSNFNTVFALCNEYYDYSDGKTMMQINDYYYYFLTQMHSLGGNFIENNTINTDSREFEEVFMPLAKAAIYGGLSTDDGYASDKWKTAELISSIGSTAGIMYMRDYVTYENGDDENIETMVYTYPTFDGAKPAVIQRGTGIFGVKSDDEKKNEAIALFVKWLTEKEHNLHLTTEMGYLPVTKVAFEALFENLNEVENPKYRLVYEAISQMYDKYDFIPLPLFDNSADVQKKFEESVKTVLSEAHKTYIKRINDGADKEAVLNKLLRTSLNSLKKQLR